ncbi:hypothetical protein C5167_028819 [Papaver somniferum]|nr:hypothetical protein C5167_028819 [Papaver somniferum]
MGRDKNRREPRNSSDDEEDDDVDKVSREMKEITKEEINEYLVKKAQKKVEIETVKKRREERAMEKSQHEEEMLIGIILRACESRTSGLGEKGKGAALGRSSDVCEFEVDELDEPCMAFKGLAVKYMEELLVDMNMHLNLDSETPNHKGDNLWSLAGYVVTIRSSKKRARVRGKVPPAELLAEERRLYSSIEGDIDIESQMRAGTAKVIEYGEAVVKRLHIFNANAFLKEIICWIRKTLLKVEHDDPKPQAEEDIKDVWPYSPRLKLKEERNFCMMKKMRRQLIPTRITMKLGRECASKVMGDIVEGEAVFSSGAE